MNGFKKLLLPALNPPSRATLISSCPADARALARRPDRADIGYRAATSAASSRAGCRGEVAGVCVGCGLEGEDPIQPAPLLDDEHVAAHGACQVVGRATPKRLVDPGMSGEADH